MDRGSITYFPVLAAMSSGICYVKCLCMLLYVKCLCVLLYVKCLCVLSHYISPIAEIWIILSGIFCPRDKKISIKKMSSAIQRNLLKQFTVKILADGHSVTALMDSGSSDTNVM